MLIFASIVISKWGYRFGVPTLLLFLFTGMLFGSDAPMAYVLTIALVEMIVSAGEFSGMDLASKIVGQLAVGGCWAI